MPSGAIDVHIIALLAALMIIVAVAALAATRRRGRAGTHEPIIDEDGPPHPLPVVVANPTKIEDMDGERAWLARRCTELAWRRPLWFETQVDEPGQAAAREAIGCGARTVLAYGGDGTVRNVAAGLEGSGTSLAILPMGTGNLLARNLGIPLYNHELAVEVALAGRERLIDVGHLEIDVSGEDTDPVRETFLVMAGLGFDAEVMATVEPTLKERVGWWAYVVAGVRRLRGRATAVTITLDDGESVRKRVRSVIIGNCGELTGGLTLLPDAELDDGWLDLVVVAPKRFVDWGAVVFTVLSRAKLRKVRKPSSKTVVRHYRCHAAEIRAEKPLAVQLDGDPAGDARVIRASVHSLGLTVRIP
jgi:diacylglycerol kinase (ATP)